MGPKFDYVAIQSYNPYTGEPMTFVMAEDLVKAYLKLEAEVIEGELPPYDKAKKEIPYKVVGKYKGTD